MKFGDALMSNKLLTAEQTEPVRRRVALAGQTDGETRRLPGRLGVKVPPLAANAGTGHRFARSTTEIADGALYLPVSTGKFGLDRIRAHSTSSTGHSKKSAG